MFAQVLALALAGSPEVVTLDVGDKPYVDVSAIHGDVSVRREGSGPVRLEAQLPPRGDSPDEWIFQVRADGDRVKAKVCCGQCEGRGNRDCSDGPIKLIAVMPEAAELELGCVSAKIKIEGGSGDVNVSTVSGPVEVTRTGGEVRISAVSADVKLAPAKVRDSQVSTVSGDVQLNLPDRANADVRFSTMSGDGPSRQKIGAGGAEISVSTLSGDLRVRGSRQ